MIGIFDSGIGGLTTVKAVMKKLPGYDIVYFGDTARTPYGTKSCKTIINYSLENSKFLLENGAKIIIMACNTASSVATHKVESYFTDTPVFEVISPAVEKALEQSKKQQIGIIGTRGTIKSKVYEKMIKKLNPSTRIYSAPCPLLVPLVEEGWINRPETTTIIKKYLHPLKARQIDTLVLGCTHYPVLKDIIQQKIGKKIALIDSAEAVADKVVNYLNANPDLDKCMSKNGQTDFFVSDVTDQFKKTAKSIIKKDIELKHIEF
ncbi:MAG: glutamate racemase [Desulfobacteraceae bacterium]|nr:glutamate racemase [Desulfobacteraceae bacterium]